MLASIPVACPWNSDIDLCSSVAFDARAAGLGSHYKRLVAEAIVSEPLLRLIWRHPSSDAMSDVEFGFLVELMKNMQLLCEWPSDASAGRGVAVAMTILFAIYCSLYVSAIAR